MTAPFLVLFGARAGAGFELARLARLAGVEVVAAVRPGADGGPLADLGCRVVAADACDAAAVDAVFRGLPPGPWVASTLGGRVGNDFVDDVGNRMVIDAARKHGAARMLLVSSLGAGDSRAFASPRLLAAIGDVLAAKTRAEDHLRASGLVHVILRPGGLVDGSPSGSGELSAAHDVHGSISRGELARLALLCLTSGAHDGATLSAVDPKPKD
ncbi:NAD-dependent epimerase/dehydratase [uncultured Alphaproteobacteria bacterium]|uniref:NAD-dependent epimerase/dehydratase n=1 Tax=uncultured Alphaproteobacteria bacterium TaxID=91750 RepID=A0A212IU78_9PROT|nr:NAD-dependent epimerase/dehydratase [uncultured Alphaproteobacteria bacterium]